MKRIHESRWRLERAFEASRTRPPSRAPLKGAAAQAARERDDMRRRWARRTESARSLRALAQVVGAGRLPLGPLTVPLTLNDCRASCLCRLERAEHLALRAQLREIQDAEDLRRAGAADQTLDLAELLY